MHFLSRTVQPGATQPLNSIITTSRDTLAEAAECDAARAVNGGPRSLLDGIPIVLKDNYDTDDMPPTAGCTLTVGYDPKAFTLVGTDINARGVSNAATKDASVTVSNTKIGTSPGSEGATTLVTLTFRARKANSTSKVELTDLDTANSKDALVSVV